jgi:hypothetical protein
MRASLGSIYRAVAPFAPEPPFRIYAGEKTSPIVVNETPRLTEAEQVEFTVLIPVKARPVLVISEPSRRYNEVLALRLRRLSRLTEAERLAALSDEADDLVCLDPRLCPGLEEENAAIVTTAMRLPVSALDLARPLGRLDGDEVRSIHERLVSAHCFDLREMIADQAREMVANLGG